MMHSPYLPYVNIGQKNISNTSISANRSV
jgi:hypothetical protein